MNSYEKKINSDEWLVLPYLERFIEKICTSNDSIKAVVGSGSFFRGIQYAPYSTLRFTNQRLENVSFGVNKGIDLRFVYNDNIIITPKKEVTYVNIGNSGVRVVSYHKSIATDRKQINEARSTLNASIPRIYSQGLVVFSKGNKSNNEIYELKDKASEVYSNPPFEQDNQYEIQSRLDAISELRIAESKLKLNINQIDESFKSLFLTGCLYLNGIWKPRKRFEVQTYNIIDPEYYKQTIGLVNIDDVKNLLKYIEEKYRYEELIKINPRENLQRLKKEGLH